MGIVGRGLQRVNNYLEAPPRGPRYHGDKNDPRYPSPREWRVFFAPIIDIALHAGLAATVLIKVSGLAGVALAIVAYVVVSFVHTVVVQRITHATVGKAVFGLVLIRGNDGNWPTTGRLIVWYFVRVLITALTLADGFGGSGDPDPHLVAVRRRDVNALRPDMVFIRQTPTHRTTFRRPRPRARRYTRNAAVDGTRPRRCSGRQPQPIRAVVDRGSSAADRWSASGFSDRSSTTSLRT